MYPQDQQDQQDQQQQMGQNDQSADDTLAGNQDTRPTFDPGGRVIDAPEGAPRTPGNNVTELPDGRTVEVPPGNLAAAKELLAAQKAADAQNAQQDQQDQQDQIDQQNQSDHLDSTDQ